MVAFSLPVKGFLGTGATFEADLNLVVQLVMGAALIAGAFLAKQKRYRAHGICQTTVLLLNLLMIGLVMWPSFRQHVKPTILSGHSQVVLRRADGPCGSRNIGGTARTLYRSGSGHRCPSNLVTFCELEAVDASGICALASLVVIKWSWDLLRLVYRAIPLNTKPELSAN